MDHLAKVVRNQLAKATELKVAYQSALTKEKNKVRELSTTLQTLEDAVVREQQTLDSVVRNSKTHANLLETQTKALTVIVSRAKTELVLVTPSFFYKECLPLVLPNLNVVSQERSVDKSEEKPKLLLFSTKLPTLPNSGRFVVRELSVLLGLLRRFALVFELHPVSLCCWKRKKSLSKNKQTTNFSEKSPKLHLVSCNELSVRLNKLRLRALATVDRSLRNQFAKIRVFESLVRNNEKQTEQDCKKVARIGEKYSSFRNRLQLRVLRVLLDAQCEVRVLDREVAQLYQNYKNKLQ